MRQSISTLLIFIISFLLLNFVPHAGFSQVFCHANGNVVIYSNYDGGYLFINVDENIPDLKIGVTTYEKCEIHIGGPYASNVSQVLYAGYNASNDHCTPSPPTTDIFGVSSSITNIVLYPPVTWVNSNGYYYIICNYSCDSAAYQGGCNTPDQIVHYYITEFGGSLYYHYTQYGCWQDTFYVSGGGNCCIGADIIPPENFIDAAFSVPNDTMCAKDSVFFMNTSLNTYPGGSSYSWDFGDGTSIDTSENPVHVFNTNGTYTVTLTVTDSSGAFSDITQLQMVILNCFTGIDDNASEQMLRLYPNPVTDICCLDFEESTSQELSVSLYDSKGMMIFEKEADGILKEWCFSPSDFRLGQGIYCVVVDYNGKRFREKLMVGSSY